MPATVHADRSLPTGTVTFLFADIEGSTRLWDTQHAVMQQALVHHDAVMRDAIEANSGYLVKTTGDGALAAFALAADAVAACLSVQRVLQAHAWGGLSIKSRMALHSGAAEERDGDYYGPAINRAARLMTAGHGGQILLSLATAELVRDHLPASIALRDMGERRLKDLIRPERVYQLVSPDLPGDFPPLSTLDARPNNLPAQTTAFIGREHEILAVREQLSKPDVRLLTLSGFGGTGKTRLALQVAGDLIDEFEHGVFFVPLAALSDPALVLSTIAQVFDVREAAGRPYLEQLQDYLREKQLLLVLDNFEQVVEAAPRLSDLLSAASRLKILVTSREVLRLSGETDYPVPPLSLPDLKQLPPLAALTQYEAVTLFIERAQAAKPGFAVTNENAPAVAEICHRLDGLPLAIELAAVRVRVLPPQRMLAELSHRLTFLDGGGRDRPARQKTLRSAIDWSHDLLTAAEQQLFRRLAVFVGGCGLDAIEAICNIDTDLDLLVTIESLVGKSLVKQAEAAGEPRFAMLETIREYAGERLLAAGETQRVRELHRDCFLALAEETAPKLLGAEQTAWLKRLEEEHDNLRSALESSLAEHGSDDGLRLCVALQRFWCMRGHLTEGREYCVRALGKAGSQEQTQARAKALSVAGVLAHYQSDYATSRALHAESLALRRHLDDRSGMAASLNNVGSVALSQGDLVSARTLFEESLAIKSELGDQRGIANSLNNLGSVALAHGELVSARALFEKSLAIKRGLGDAWGIAASLGDLGQVAQYQGDYAAARALYEESLAIGRQLSDRHGIATSMESLGSIAHGQGDHVGAVELYRECLAILRELGDRRGVASVVENLAAAIAVPRGSLGAARIWGAAERLREEIESPRPPSDRPRYDRSVAEARAALGDDAAFDRAWQEGRALTLEQAIELALETTRGRT